LGGILIEGGQTKVGEPTWMVIGIGINLRNADSFEIGLDVDAMQKVGSLDQLIPPSSSLPDMEFIWLKLIESLESYLTDFDQSGFASYQHHWERWDAFREQHVCISGANKDPIDGIAKGIDEYGALLLKQNNQTITIHAGDVSLRVQS
jgi:BirA family biotin operon repressor/biotin-[acetyl-CoA-carboxylase] ligase